MKREADFTTNPEGIPTKDPRRAIRNNQRRGVWSHLVDVNEIKDFITDENIEMANEAFLAGAKVDEFSARRIASALIDEAVGIGQSHNAAEYDLREVNTAIVSVKKCIRDNKALSLNPFVKKEFIKNSSGQLNVSLQKLGTKERKLRRILDRTNAKMPDQLQEYPHVPLADKDE